MIRDNCEFCEEAQAVAIKLTIRVDQLERARVINGAITLGDVHELLGAIDDVAKWLAPVPLSSLRDVYANMAATVEGGQGRAEVHAAIGTLLRVADTIRHAPANLVTTGR